jgi:polysaccharide biosynthesis/export protein
LFDAASKCELPAGDFCERRGRLTSTQENHLLTITDAKLKLSRFSGMTPVRVARAFRLPITAIVTAFALSGCMRTSGPVAAAKPQGDLDSMAYGETYAPASVAVADSSGGASGTLRSAFAASPRRTYAAAPAASVQPVRYDTGYHLDAGDKLRVVVYGQEGLTNTYAIDAAGSITMPLIGQVAARGRTPAGLATQISAKLRGGYIRDPSVAVEIEAYRPFFILGEVAAPGQYPYVPNMTVESAVAIAGGFSPRARRDSVTLTHTDASGSGRFVVPLGSSLSPGDTVFVGERWF